MNRNKKGAGGVLPLTAIKKNNAQIPAQTKTRKSNKKGSPPGII